MEIVDLTALDGRGPAWGTACEELNATLLVWRAGEGQPEHVNEGLDVAVVALAGSGTLSVDGIVHQLTAGTLAIVPRGSTRSVVAGPEGLRCLTVHRRRGGLGMRTSGDWRRTRKRGDAERRVPCRKRETHVTPRGREETAPRATARPSELATDCCKLTHVRPAGGRYDATPRTRRRRGTLQQTVARSLTSRSRARE